MGNSIRCRRRVPHAANIPLVQQNNMNIINDDENEVIEWLLIPAAHNVAANNNQALFRFRKAINKVKSILRIRYIWARVGNMLTLSRTLRNHNTRRHAILNSVWQSLRPLTWKYAQLFSHLKRTGGVLRYNIR
jgi:hypothetical protein